MIIFHCSFVGRVARARSLVMVFTAFLVITAAGMPPALAQSDGAIVVPADSTAPIDVPSGQPVIPIDAIWNDAGPAGSAVRFRFLAPEIAPGASIDFDTAAIDIAAICETYALPRVAGTDPLPDQIIISLSDREVPFGQADPDATQYFEAFSFAGDTCTWELF